MTIDTDIKNDYFNWMAILVCDGKTPDETGYKNLLTLLHSIRFRYSIPRDKNRYIDGIDLRYRFAYGQLDLDDVEVYLNGPCSIFEMMVALALRCEESIMDNPAYGNRTGQWFWRMVTSLGLGAMDDYRFDETYVRDVISRFLAHDYEPNGRGGLFTIKSETRDLRKAEIYYQLCWYLDSIM